MNKPQGIVVFGANGSGKTTLGRELARLLKFKHMDIEDYIFKQSDIPNAIERSREDCQNLMLADIEKHRAFVMTSVIGDFGDTIPLFYELAVFISAPLGLRLERIKRRAYEQHGERVRKGGDMYEQELEFIEYVAARPLSKIEKWAETLVCPVIHVDGTEDWRVNAKKIVKQFYKLKSERSIAVEL